MKQTFLYTIFSRDLAFKLAQKGFKCYGTGVNSRYSDKQVYFFKNTPELHYDIYQYKNNK